jgi:hypothetical protein
MSGTMRSTMSGREESRAATTPAVRGKPWQPGQSGNPGGRPVIAREVRDLARSHGPEAIAKLAHLMRSSKDDRVQLAAAEELLNRGYGRPMQQVHIEHEETVSPFAHLSPDQKRELAAMLTAKVIEHNVDANVDTRADEPKT